jgi:hypothetical protein
MVDTAPLDWMRTCYSMHLSLTSFPRNSSDFDSNLINSQFSDSAPASLLPLPMASGLLLRLTTWECHSKILPSSCLCLRKFLALPIQCIIISLFRYDAASICMVLPVDELRANICCTGMHNGNNACDERYPKFAEVSQTTTVHVFVGQGSQEPSMGMCPYNGSPVVGELPGQVLMPTSLLYMVFSPRDCPG